MKLRSVELQMPGLEPAAAFLRDVWLLHPVGRSDATVFFQGTGDDPYLLAITEAAQPAVRSLTFSGHDHEVEQLRTRARNAGIKITDIVAADEPGSGSGVLVTGPEHQAFRFLTSDSVPAAQLPAEDDRPVQLTHTVINTCDLAACEQFALSVLGLQVSDRTRAMSFLRCNRKHHCIAYAPASVPSLNHIAFEMRDTDAVMRGIGRMQDAGFACAWGPGRHGPGDNVFAYFLAPFGGIIEYTSEVSDIDEHYRVGTPADWTWPPGRIDQWGVSRKDLVHIGAAEKHFRFASPDSTAI